MGKRKYSLDETIFENIDSEEKAYWLGFILADGNIYINVKNYQYLLQIGLATKDSGHLEKFKRFLKTDIPVKFCNTKYKYCMLQICSRKIVNDLIDLGINPRKSKKEKFIKLKNDKLQKHFIRGLWDGDGSVRFTYKDTKYKNNLIPITGLCGTYELISEVQKHFSNKLSLVKVNIQKNGCIFQITRTHTSAKKIIEYLYKDSFIYLDRKYKNAIKSFGWSPKINRSHP